MSFSYPGHLESAALSCGASGPAVGVSVSVCGQRGLLSAWPGRVSGRESPRGNAWETHFQNLDKD